MGFIETGNCQMCKKQEGISCSDASYCGGNGEIRIVTLNGGLQMLVQDQIKNCLARNKQQLEPSKRA